MTLHAGTLAATEPRQPTLGLMTPHNVHDLRSFSGTAYHAARALKRAGGLHFRVLGTHRPPGWADRLTRRFTRAPDSSGASASVDLSDLDIVVGLVASEMLDRLPPDMPFIHVTDATPGFLADVYGRDAPTATRRREARVAHRAAACVYSSRWMANRACDELSLAGAHALPFGINLAPVAHIVKPPLRPIEMLFVGADWDRKGGEISRAALVHLRAAGVPAHLTCVGRIPAHVEADPDIAVAGFLDKTRPRHERRLADLYARAHLLVLPTRGDCTPMVIAEAMAHGTPVLATETGGIPEMIGGDGAGRCLPMAARPEDWADAIVGMTRDPDAFAWMSDAARDRAATRFSWDAWASGIVTIAENTLQQGAHAA